MTTGLRFLVAESELPHERDQRRRSVGRSSGETYMDILRELAPDASCERVTPSDPDPDEVGPGELEGYDAVFLTGSPMRLWQDTPETRRQLDFMRAVFGSGTPAFGSCAGLQVATVAAGGTVRPNADGYEAAFSRRIVRREKGRDHPLLDGRPDTWDAPAIHSDEVERLPEGGRVLASNPMTDVQAAEIRLGPGIFWGVQYHPELSLAEIAAALERQAGDLVDDGLATGSEGVRNHAALIRSLGEEPERRDLAWRLGLDREVTDVSRRRTELRNFIGHLVRPTRSRRGRA